MRFIGRMNSGTLILLRRRADAEICFLFVFVSVPLIIAALNCTSRGPSSIGYELVGALLKEASSKRCISNARVCVWPMGASFFVLSARLEN